MHKIVIGAAGTGKSWRINSLCAENPRYALKTSSSGISAVNIGATTIHSTLGYFNTQQLLYKVIDGSIFQSFKKIAKKYDRIFIDEISMLPGQQLDLLYRALELYHEGGKGNPLTLECSGDPGQLPPVSKEGEPAYSFIQAECFHKFDIEYLNEVKRQDNQEFIRALLLIRAGRGEEAAEWFEKNIGFHSTLDPDFEGTTILATNRDVDVYNARALSKLSTTEKWYEKKITGKNKGEWNAIPEKLVVKPGSKVILLANKLPEYSNGDLATIREVFADFALVRINRTGKEYLVGYHTLTNNDLVTGKEVGQCSFMPLRLADSSTVHKMQGLTLDRMQFRITDKFLQRLSGGMYTGASRVRTPGGLRLVGNKDAFIKACYISPIYKPYVQMPEMENYIAA